MPFPLTTPWHQKKRPVSSGLLSKRRQTYQLLTAISQTYYGGFTLAEKSAV
ncbi:MAG: hypothetical protein AAGI66_05220 [Cyanobacteria bacterium P01_H01_bin.74]